MLYSPAHGDVAQLGEHRLCKPGVEGSSPFVSTREHAGRERFSSRPVSCIGAYSSSHSSAAWRSAKTRTLNPRFRQAVSQNRTISVDSGSSGSRIASRTPASPPSAVTDSTKKNRSASEWPPASSVQSPRSRSVSLCLGELGGLGDRVSEFRCGERPDVAGLHDG